MENSIGKKHHGMTNSVSGLTDTNFYHNQSHLNSLDGVGSGVRFEGE